MGKEMKKVSLLKGYSFSFEYQGHEIKAWFSALSGAEKVYLDGRLVASQRNLKQDSQNDFLIDGESFSTSISVESILKGPITCTLLKDGIAIKKQHLTFPSTEPSSSIVFVFRLILLMMFGFFFGIAQYYFDWPSWTLLLFVVAVFTFLYSTSRKKYSPIFEEESYV